jgi:hypothetical protein
MILPFRNGEFRNGGFDCKDTTYFLPEKNRVTQYFKERFLYKTSPCVEARRSATSHLNVVLRRNKT